MKILLTTIPSDSHTWNLVFMQLFLQENGCEVINLGACTPTDLVIKTAYSESPDLIVVSSINGHANIEGIELINALQQRQFINNIKTVIGGKLGTKGDKNYIYKEKLIKAGFTAVFDGNSLSVDFAELKTLLQNKAPTKASIFLRKSVLSQTNFFAHNVNRIARSL